VVDIEITPEQGGALVADSWSILHWSIASPEPGRRIAIRGGGQRTSVSIVPRFAGSQWQTSNWMVLSADARGELQFAEEAGEEIFPIYAEGLGVRAAVAGGGRFVVSSSNWGTLQFWDLLVLQNLHRGLGMFDHWGSLHRAKALGVRAHSREIIALEAVDALGVVLTASVDESLVAWNVESRAKVASFHFDHPPTCLAASRDGALIVAGDRGGYVHFLQPRGFDGIVAAASQGRPG
jgi:hypothetical protein